MKNKGFTLIELLAVIVILAIIALIAIPIVLNIIDNTKSKSQLQSAQFYLVAVDHALLNSEINKIKIQDGTYKILESGNLCLEYNEDICIKELEVEVNGEIPNSGTITIENKKINKVELKYLNGKIIVKNSDNELKYKTTVCSVVSGDGTSVGDEIECADQYFYVISNDGETISMFSKYNLDVGKYYDTETTLYKSIENPTGIQSDKARGGISSTEKYGVLAFSNSIYWTSNGLKQEYGTSYPAWIYTDKDGNVDPANNIYPYVKAYEDYLKEKGVNSAKGTLISYDQLIMLGCDNKTSACSSSIDGVEKGGTAPSWVYYTSYWCGTGRYNYPWIVSYDGTFVSINYNHPRDYGVRPVINILVSEI